MISTGDHVVSDDKLQQIKEFDEKLRRITFKNGMLMYFIRNFRESSKKILNAEEFSGLLCSGIVPIWLNWIEEELIPRSEDMDLEELAEKMKEYTSMYR